MSNVFSAPTPKPPPPPPTVAPKPVVRPAAPVQAGQRQNEEKKLMKRVRTGLGTQARRPSVLGASGSSTTKTLLGQ